MRSLILRAREGDSIAFEQLLENFHGSIFSLLCKWTGNWHDAEDLTQETFIKAYKYLKTFRIEENFKTWLYKIALNLAHSHYKRSATNVAPIDEVLETNLQWKVSLPEKIFQMQLLRTTYEVLPQLTVRERSVFVLKTMEGLDNDEISNILRISSTTVRRFYGIARKKLLAAAEQKTGVVSIQL